MKAAFITSLEKTEHPLNQLKMADLPKPEVGPGQALIKVRRVSLNHHDLWTLKGVSGTPLTFPRILGCEASGIVEAYGPDSPENLPTPGSEVMLYPIVTCGKCRACRSSEPLFCREFGMLSDKIDGTFADYVVLPAQNVLPKPASLSLEEAACFGVTYLTAFRMLFTRGELKAGESVLIQGGAGGVGSAAIQLAHAGGLTIFATSRTEEKRAFARQLGAHTVLESGASARPILAQTGGRGVDAVIETVGEATWKESLRAVRPGGRVVVAGTTGGANPPAELGRVFWRQLSVVGSTMGTLSEFQTLLSLVQNANIRPPIDEVFSFNELPQAFARMNEGNLKGKLVIAVDE
jgi:NADPH:quinone reductase-like Zn-dependent oxidoreductase